jgi:hypothetical protein
MLQLAVASGVATVEFSRRDTVVIVEPAAQPLASQDWSSIAPIDGEVGVSPLSHEGAKPLPLRGTRTLRRLENASKP